MTLTHDGLLSTGIQAALPPRMQCVMFGVLTSPYPSFIYELKLPVGISYQLSLNFMD